MPQLVFENENKAGVSRDVRGALVEVLRALGRVREKVGIFAGEPGFIRDCESAVRELAGTRDHAGKGVGPAVRIVHTVQDHVGHVDLSGEAAAVSLSFHATEHHHNVIICKSIVQAIGDFTDSGIIIGENLKLFHPIVCTLALGQDVCYFLMRRADVWAMSSQRLRARVIPV